MKGRSRVCHGMVVGMAMVVSLRSFVRPMSAQSPTDKSAQAVNPSSDTGGEHSPYLHITGNRKVDALVERMTLDEKLQLVHGVSDLRTGHISLDAGQPCDGQNCAGTIKGIPRLGIPDIFISDGEFGINVIHDATMFPSPVGLAASFDREAARLHGLMIGKEARSLGIHVVLAPRVNIARAVLTNSAMSNGGNFQTFGEDPFLNGEIGAAEVKGLQTDNNAIANAKQMLGSSTGAAMGVEYSIIDPQTMHEIYMPAFQALVDAGVGSAMSNYNRVNGTWTSEYGEMMNKMLRERWGFRGFIVCDWGGLENTNAIRNGLDLEMPGGNVIGKKLKQDILSGKISESYLDMSVGRILETLDGFGMLDHPRSPSKGEVSESQKEESAAAARKLAAEEAVLLKNDGQILPIAKTEKIGIIGANGRVLATPVFKESAFGFADRRVSPLRAMEKLTENQIPNSVGVDQQGVPIPATMLLAEDGKSHGLSRYKASDSADHFTSPFGPISNTRDPKMAFEAIDPGINFVGSAALPRAKYEWWGSIIAPEDGDYLIMQQTDFPDAKTALANANTPDVNPSASMNGDMWIDGMSVSRGARILMNGGPAPYASMMTSEDGLNNASAYVHLTKGHHDFRMTAHSLFAQPVGIRLNWVTPSMHAQNIADAVQMAKTVDKVVLFAWYPGGASLGLPQGQDGLVDAVSTANPNTIVVLNTGGPVAMPWKDRVKAILNMWIPGQEGGWGTADVLHGKLNPGGKLPVTFPVDVQQTPVGDPEHPERQGPIGRSGVHGKAEFTEGVDIGYRWYDEHHVEPLFPFGFGLSYTSFSYSDLTVRVEKNHDLTVSFTVKNDGDVAGSEVPQVYVGRPPIVPTGVQMSPKLLAAFTRITLAPHDSTVVTLHLDRQRLSYWDVKSSDWALAPGERPILVGSSSRDIRLTGRVVIGESSDKAIDAMSTP